MLQYRLSSRRSLQLGVALGAMIGVLLAPSAQAQQRTAVPAVSPQAQATRVEQQQYVLRVMTQVHDGLRDLSHSQLLAVARYRSGQRSFTQFDYGDGAVVLTGNDGSLAASRFANLSGAEKAVIYDYDTRMMYGDDGVAMFHNGIVQPLLGLAPELGADASWDLTLPLKDIGVLAQSGDTVQIELSRQYFTHDGKPMVLVHYAVPAFTYTGLDGRQVVHWGQGLSLTDPGFGMIYLNATLHRSVARSGDESVPYRYARSMVAANPDGSAMVDYRDVPQLAPYIKDLFGEAAMRVVSTAESAVSSAPLDLARNLDVVALSIGEDGGNEVPMASAAQTAGARGIEAFTAQSAEELLQAQSEQQMAEQIAQQLRADAARDAAARNAISGNTSTAEGMQVNPQTRPAPDSGLGAEAFTTSEGPQPGALQVLPHEQTHTVQGVGGQGNTGASLGDEVTPGVIDALNRSRNGGGGLQGALPVPADSAMAFGGPGETENPYFDNYGITGQDGSLAQSQYWFDKANAIIGGNLSRFGELAVEQQAETVAQLAQNLARQSMATGNQINQLIELIETTEDWLRVNGAAVPMLTREAQALETGVRGAATRLGQAEGAYESLLFQMAEHTNAGTRPPANLASALDVAESELSLARRGMQQAENAFELAVESGGYVLELDVTDPRTASMVERLGQAYRRLGETNGSLLALQKQAEGISALMNGIPVQRAAEFIGRLGNSTPGRILDGLSHTLNAYTTGKASHNVYRASTTNMSSGDLNLTRNHTGMELGLDILALGGNLASGNVRGFFSDAAAVASGSLSDIYVANKAWNDTITDNQRRSEEVLANLRRLTQMIQADEKRKMAELMATEYGLYTNEPANDGGVTDPNWRDPRIDPESGLPKPGYWAYLKANHPGTLASYGIDPEAPVGGWPGGVGPEHRPGNQPPVNREPPIDPQAIRDRFQDAFRPDYPTAPPRNPTARPTSTGNGDVMVGATSQLSDEQLAEIEREQRRQQAQRDLEDYQRQRLAELQAEEEARRNRPRGEPFRITPLQTSALVISAFDIDPVGFDPVTFDPVTWTPPEWDPPEWVSPEFDPPEISRFPATDPDDTDGYPGTGEYPAFEFGNMSGRVETSLAKWEEWLATQDVRYLERLALQAGYPNLASALADADNLLRQVADSGWVTWALAPPSCAGYAGCGPQYSERWAAKRSRLALGNILERDRDFFSSAGLTDVQIAGLFFAFTIFDFGQQDGDVVTVTINQFGRTLLNQTLTTTNAGTAFNIPVQRGVVGVQMLAENTGAIPPNTAGLIIQSVTGGEENQQYSLNTGETADLRVTVGAD